MSWSQSFRGTGPAVVEAIDQLDITLGGEAKPEVEEQIAVAKKLAKQLVESGAVGRFDDGTEFGVSINGHANPQHNSHGSGTCGVSVISSPELAPLNEEPVPSDETEYIERGGEPEPEA